MTTISLTLSFDAHSVSTRSFYHFKYFTFEDVFFTKRDKTFVFLGHGWLCVFVCNDLWKDTVSQQLPDDDDHGGDDDDDSEMVKE